MAKYIRFERNGVLDGHPVYLIVNKKHIEIIGRIAWFNDWKQYVADFDEDSVWSHDCLADVQAKLVELNGDGK